LNHSEAKAGLFLLQPSKARLLLFLVEPFFASMKQKRDYFCCDEAMLKFCLKMDTCRSVKQEARRLGASGGFLALP
jgi:hypothetical protein